MLVDYNLLPVVTIHFDVEFVALYNLIYYVLVQFGLLCFRLWELFQRTSSAYFRCSNLRRLQRLNSN